jgi:glycosyltransferase involved in cell wall biosynthesis
MKEKRKILIISPALDNLGGTELETIITAKVFLENNLANTITIFSPNKACDLVKSFSDQNEILFKNYPEFYNHKYLLRIDYNLKKIFKLFHQNYSPIQYFFWFIKSLFSEYDFLYIITSSTQVYYAPIIVNFNKTIIKFTYGFQQTNWDKKHLALLKKCCILLVTAVSQKSLLKTKFKIDNIEVVDVFIWNEERLNKISVEIGEKFIFGMLCRISKEKQIEDGIRIIKKLHDFGHNVSLVIRGPSLDKQYLDFLNNLIIELNVNEFVTLEAIPIEPIKIPDFYQNINAFLITSSVEGGPNTGIECLAAGIPILSYDIGAMFERLEPFKDQLIAVDFDSLYKKALLLLNLGEVNYQNLSKSLKKHYQENFTNKLKLEKTVRFLP